jgi:hypothetical protein
VIISHAAVVRHTNSTVGGLVPVPVCYLFPSADSAGQSPSQLIPCRTLRIPLVSSVALLTLPRQSH